MFTRKHFQAFAEVIRGLENQNDAIKMTLLCIEVFSESNGRFNKAMFVPACGFEDSKFVSTFN